MEDDYLDKLESNSQDHQEYDSHEEEDEEDQIKVTINPRKKEENYEFDPLARFRNLNLDQLNKRLRQLEYDIKKLIYETQKAKNQVKLQEGKIQTYRQRIIKKQKGIEDEQKYTTKLEQSLKQVKIQLMNLTSVSDYIEKSFHPKKGMLLDQTHAPSEEISELQNQEDSFSAQQCKFNDDSIQIKNPPTKKRKIKKLKSKYSHINGLSIKGFNKLDGNPEDVCSYNRGAWNPKERQQYTEFAAENMDILDKPELCYQYRIFRQMSNYIGTRDLTQCRLFHNQVMKGKKPN